MPLNITDDQAKVTSNYEQTTKLIKLITSILSTSKLKIFPQKLNLDEIKLF
jgi:hypothetical protein